MFASHSIKRAALLSSAVLLAACAKKENAAADSSSMAASTTSSTSTAAPAPASSKPINLADVAGKWNMRAVPTSGTDTTPTTYVLTATNTTSGWTIMFPGRKPQPVNVVAQGDSLLITSPVPYPSARRKGVQVTTNGVLRLQNGDLAGTTTAHYVVKTPDSVLVVTVSGTRTK